MIKLIIFDLDGVLINTKMMHYNALNSALPVEYKILLNEHMSRYDGLKTRQKLKMLSKEKGLPIDQHDKIWKDKQYNTLLELNNITPSPDIIHLFSTLAEKGYSIAVCSNSIRKTVLTVLCKLQIIEHIDIIISNQDVQNSKPHPEMFWKAISSFSYLPSETLIIEDSPTGLFAASLTTASVMRVATPEETTWEKVSREIEKIDNKHMKPPKWKDKKLNVLIPMAGAGSRFEQAGYTFPKPLIDVNGKPMIEVVVDNLNIDANYIYIVQKEHRVKYNLDTLLNLITPDCNIIQVDGITDGAACTALLAKDLIQNDQPLLFANSDQFIEWNSNEFMYKMNETNADGGIVTFESTHPKWSFVKVNENGLVTEVAEKNPISNTATVGIYYWKHGKDFVKYAEQMIASNKRINNEFYVCPVFNEAITDGKNIRTKNVESMWGLGTPEDLNHYLNNFC